MANNKKNKTKNTAGDNRQQPATVAERRPRTIYGLLMRVAVVAAVVVGAICYTDSKGWFHADVTNNHTLHKWDSYYQFTRRNAIDVVLVGNSHLYTGINPKHLSNALGANCFILASPGTTLTDAYFCLKEAIAVKKPRIAVVETYSISDYDSHHLSAGQLSDQIKSFDARRDIGQKLLSTPILFTSDEYLPAWSSTLRNHDFIFTDHRILKLNYEGKNTQKKEKLYLGRFAMFTSGLQDSTIRKYDIQGASVDGANFQPSDEAREYIKKTIKLCKDNDIELIFLTLPMYYRHISHYDTWKARLAEAFRPDSVKWLDLQMPYDTAVFTPECFENNARANQHMTYTGSIIAAYKLAGFIDSQCPGILTDRSQDAKWKDLFFDSEGYVENHLPVANDSTTVIVKDMASHGPTIKDITFLKRKQYNMLLAKIERRPEWDLSHRRIRITISATLAGNPITSYVDLQPDRIITPPHHYLFSSPIRKDVTIEKVLAISFY